MLIAALVTVFALGSLTLVTAGFLTLAEDC
jgi:hypothetical protein